MAKEAIKIVETKAEKVKRERRHKDISLTEIVPEPFSKALKSVWMLALIPISLVVGIIDGVCKGYLCMLETTIELYRRELGK